VFWGFHFSDFGPNFWLKKKNLFFQPFRYRPSHGVEMSGGVGDDQVGGSRGATDDRDVKNVITLSLPGGQGEVDITLPVSFM
jgi:hypothetical protein